MAPKCRHGPQQQCDAKEGLWDLKSGQPGFKSCLCHNMTWVKASKSL